MGVLVFLLQHLRGMNSLPSFTRSALNPRRHTIPVWPPLQVGPGVRDTAGLRVCRAGDRRRTLLPLAGMQLLGSQLVLEDPELEGVGVLASRAR